MDDDDYDEPGEWLARRVGWLESLGCCSHGHVTVPARGITGKPRCVREHLGCPFPVAMIKDYPPVLAAMLLGETTRVDGQTAWDEITVFEMLINLGAWANG